MDSKEIVKLAYKALDEKQAEDIKVIEIGELTVIADYFIIANGSNQSQIQAMLENVEETLGKVSIHPKRIEGTRNSTWILMDYTDVIIHIFDREDRLFYDLERIWRDGKDISIDDL